MTRSRGILLHVKRLQKKDVQAEHNGQHSTKFGSFALVSGQRSACRVLCERALRIYVTNNVNTVLHERQRQKKGLNAKFYLCECVTKETVCLTTVLLCGSLYFSNDKLYLGLMNDRQMFSLRGCVSSSCICPLTFWSEDVLWISSLSFQSNSCEEQPCKRCLCVTDRPMTVSVV